MFDSDKDLIHFVFANDDTYVRKSLIMLDRQRCLYSELKERKYKTVLFVDIVGNDYRIVCGDSTATQMYEKCNKKQKSGLKKFFDSFQKEQSDAEDFCACSTEYTIAREEKNELVHLLDKIMSGNKRTAFVFSIEAMASFQGKSAAIDMLMKQRKENYDRNNLLLIVSDTHLDASFEKLTNRDGIFQSEAFPEIREICQDYSDVRLYTKMQQKMSNRVTYFNDMKRDEIQRLLILSILEQGEHIREKLDCLEDYTDFLWLMVHSAKFAHRMQKKDPQLKRVYLKNDRRRFSVLQETLQNPAIYECMDLLIETIRKDNFTTSFINLVNADDIGKEYQVYIYRNIPLYDQLNNLTFHDDMYRNDIKHRDVIEEINVRLKEICAELVKPHVISDEKNHKILDSFINEMYDGILKADAYCDYEAMKIGVDAIHYAVCKCEQEMLNSAVETRITTTGDQVRLYKGQDTCLKCYRDALKAQLAVGDQKRKIDEYQVSLQKITKKIQEIIEKIKEMQSLNPDIEQKSKETGTKSVVVKEYQGLKMEGNALRKNMNSIKLLMDPIRIALADQEAYVGVCLSNINSVEDAKTTISMDALSMSLEEADEMLEKIEKNKKKIELFHNELKQKTASMESYQDAELDDNLFDLDEELSFLMKQKKNDNFDFLDELFQE